MDTEFTPFMRQFEQRFKATTQLHDRSQYKIFYGQVRPAWILTLGINPGGLPSKTNADGRTNTSGNTTSASASYFEKDEHDVLDCEWKENIGLRKLLLPLLDGNLSRIRHEVVKTNLAFRRSAKASQIEKKYAFDESSPFLEEIIGVVLPKLILLTGPSLASFNDRFAQQSVLLCEPQRKDSINQTVFAASKSLLRATNSDALIVQVAHASQWSSTYQEYDVAGRIRSLIKTLAPTVKKIRLRRPDSQGC